MRSENETPSICEETDVKVICAVEEAAEEYKDCPAACRKDNTKEEDNNSDEVVKAGDLDVTTSGNQDGKLFIGRDSELDTITLKTSEEVTISKIVLERIGYSTANNIVSVRLEDEKGATIADSKTLDSKGQVKLTLKKDYKVVDGELNAVIVVNTKDTWADALAAGATVGFKVVDVESTAKDTNISAKANTYTAIKFDGSKITFNLTKATSTKEYNWEAGEVYEVAKFKVTAPDDSSIILRGFTFAKKTTDLDLRKYFDKAEVTVAGEKVSGLEASVNKDDELVVTFKDVEVPAKKKQEVIVKVALTEDFDTFGWVLNLALKDFVAVDGKVESRVAAQTVPANVTNGVYDYYGSFTEYKFNGGKIKFANVKLGNVDAAQNSEDIIVAEWTVTVNEAIKGTATIKATGKWAWAIKQMAIIVNGEETESNPSLVKYDTVTSTTAPADWTATSYVAGKYVTYDGAIYKSNTATTAASFVATEWDLVSTEYTFTFNNVEIEKSGKIKFSADIYDNNAWDGQTVEFGTFNAASFGTTLKYEDANKPVTNGEASGSISFSKLTIQASKASLKNNVSKTVEFANKATRTEIVFDGTYTAKKGDIELNEFLIKSTATTSSTPAIADIQGYLNGSNKVTFHVYIDNEEVADADLNKTSLEATNTFNNVKIKAGESVKVRVEAEVEADNAAPFTSLSLGKYKVTLWWEDANGNSNSGKWDANTVELKVVDKWSVNVSTSATKQTILRKASDALIAQFTIKPGNGASSVDLEEISFTIAGNGSSDITLTVDDIEEDDFTGTSNRVYSMNKDVDSDGVVVKITLDDEMVWTVSLTNLKVNGKSVAKTFSKKYVDAAVEIVKQKESNGSTVFTLAVDKDSDVDVANFTVYYKNKAWTATNKSINKTFEDGDTLSVNGEADYKAEITKVAYEYTNGNTYDDTTATCSGTHSTTLLRTSPTDKELCEWSVIEIEKTWANALSDYFKIDDEDISIFKL